MKSQRRELASSTGTNVTSLGIATHVEDVLMHLINIHKAHHSLHHLRSMHFDFCRL